MGQVMVGEGVKFLKLECLADEIPCAEESAEGGRPSFSELRSDGQAGGLSYQRRSSCARMHKAEPYATQRGEAASMASSSDLADSADLHSQEWGACGRKGRSSS